jgi:protocatechuate 3,4-dioxygenase alpha subunit
MSSPARLIPTSSQTVGPFFRVGLQYLFERAPEVQPDERFINIHGRVLDCDGAPVPDAVLEFWTANASSDGEHSGYPAGFRRAPTDDQGSYSTVILKPTASRLEDGQVQAPHLLVLLFMRGLLRNLVSRVYLANSLEISSDPVMQEVPSERRATLIAQPDGPSSYRWDIALQGTGETVFFAW